MRRLSAVVIVILISIPAWGDNLFVDPNNPEGFATIADALKRAADGDVIFISEGFYSESVSVEKKVSLIGEGADKVSISYAQEGNVINIGANVDTTAHIEGLSITAKGGAGIACSQGGSVTVINCTLQRCGSQGINFHSSVSVIRNNLFVENTNGAIYLYRDQGSLISNNVIKNHPGGTRDNWNATGAVFMREPSGNTVFANNLIKGNAVSGLIVWGGSPTLKNNVVVENGGHGIYFHGTNVALAAPLITSNIITQNTALGLTTWQNSTPAITYNCVFDNGQGEYGEGVSQDVGGIEEDPEFVAPRNDDYHLKETSPCVDTGLTGAANVDPDGSRNDMAGATITVQ